MKRKSILFCFACCIVSTCLAAPLEQWKVENDPELTAGYHQGDMVMDVEWERNGMRNEARRWPNNTVYYKFVSKLDATHENHIRRGMQIIESVSCIRFKEAESGTLNFVAITNLDGGCYSSVGYGVGIRRYNLQNYPLDSGCFRLGTVVHEFLHTLGFYHMQSASNRDDYVRIMTENIQPGTENNFNKYDESVVDDFDIEYDYGSVMHYSAYAFSVNGEMTIVPLHEEEAADIMGQRRGMAKSDIQKLNAMYRCPIKI